MAGNVVVNLGMVEDIGRRTGAILPALAIMGKLLERDPATLTAGERQRLLELQRKHAEALGMLPENAGFQDRPDEYGEFFRHLVDEAASLSEDAANAVGTFMRGRAQLMNQLGLNRGAYGHTQVPNRIRPRCKPQRTQPSC